MRPTRTGKITDKGANDAALVDTLVGIEAFVLGGEKRLLHVVGNVGERNPDPALVLLEHFRKAMALAVEHETGTWQLEPSKLGMIRQVCDRLIIEIDHRSEVDGGGGNLFVLAELPIGGQQIGEIEPAQCLDFAGEHLRVIERGGNELVEVDVLDIEGFAHMGAARRQEADDLLLVLLTIELGFHRFRRSCDLTKRQRGRKNFDEKRFHRRRAPAPPGDPTALQQDNSNHAVPGVRSFFCARYDPG